MKIKKNEIKNKNKKRKKVKDKIIIKNNEQEDKVNVKNEITNEKVKIEIEKNEIKIKNDNINFKDFDKLKVHFQIDKNNEKTCLRVRDSLIWTFLLYYREGRKDCDKKELLSKVHLVFRNKMLMKTNQKEMYNYLIYIIYKSILMENIDFDVKTDIPKEFKFIDPASLPILIDNYEIYDKQNQDFVSDLIDRNNIEYLNGNESTNILVDQMELDRKTFTKTDFLKKNINIFQQMLMFFQIL